MALTTEVYYLERLRLYETQKPYMLTFDLPTGVGKHTNHSYAPHRVKVCDAQPRRTEFFLDTHGFQFEEWETSFSSEDFDDDEIVTSKYYPDIKNRVQELFPNALEVHVLAHLVRTQLDSHRAMYCAVSVLVGLVDKKKRRKRDKAFLKTAETEPPFPNPIVYAHTDFTPKGSVVAITPILDRNQHLKGRKYDMINVWRSTRGPNRDWPLGLCDYRTISAEDIEFSDVIHKDHVGESLRLYANSAHMWYFLDHQTTDQVAVFRNMHSDGLGVPFGAHLSFPNPACDPLTSQDQPPRESIEVRLVVFLK